MKQVTIKYMRFEHRFGRLVAMAQLFEADRLISGDAPLSVQLTKVAQEGLVLTNSQEILVALVVAGGFAS